MHEEEVWDLHLAFQAAPDRDSFYLPSAEAVVSIREYTEHNEGELALDLILAIATPNLPAAAREHAGRVARLLAPDDAPDDAVEAWVDGWLRWNLGSGVEPPFWT
jgi:hypothetical protein